MSTVCLREVSNLGRVAGTKLTVHLRKVSTLEVKGVCLGELTLWCLFLFHQDDGHTYSPPARGSHGGRGYSRSRSRSRSPVHSSRRRPRSYSPRARSPKPRVSRSVIYISIIKNAMMYCSSCTLKCFQNLYHLLMGLVRSLPRMISSKFPLQPHQKHYITQYEELGFTFLCKWLGKWTFNS